MFGKVLNFVLFFKHNLAYGILYFFLSLRKYLNQVIVQYVIYHPTNLYYSFTCIGMLQVQKLRASLLRTESYQRFSFINPVVCQNIAMHASPTDRNYGFPLSAFLVHLLPFSPPYSLSIKCHMEQTFNCNLWFDDLCLPWCDVHCWFCVKHQESASQLLFSFVLFILRSSVASLGPFVLFSS